MPFTVEMPHVDRPAPKTPAMVVDRRLYLAADEKTLIEDGDARAKWLLCAAGQTILGPTVDRLGLTLVDGRVTQCAAVLPAADEDAKSQLPSENKMRQPGEDKARGKK